MLFKNFLSEEMQFIKNFLNTSKWTWSHIIVACGFTLLFFLMGTFYFILNHEQERNIELKNYVNENSQQIRSLERKIDKLIEHTDGSRTRNGSR